MLNSMPHSNYIVTFSLGVYNFYIVGVGVVGVI